MTTVTDPTGTPSVIYNKSGVAIVEVSAAGAIPRVCGHMVALVVSPAPANVLITLPASADVGDVVEIYNEIGADVYVEPSSGETVTGPGSNYTYVLRYTGRSFRKVTSTHWVSVGAKF